MKKYMILIGTLLIVSIMALGCSNDSEESETGVNTINAEVAMEMMSSGDDFILVDVRTQEEYDEGHIEGALLLPLDQLETLSEEQLTDKDATILVYCRSGNRSAQASQLLVDLGYQNVYDFGGIVDWPGEIVK
ncbi:MAG: rhodanese-like domain-containing protein [Clostridiales bacterium]|nr:rhodanese-like domain-containing protein [Clostridiales bacterium]